MKKGIDISLKKLQEYATQRGINKKVEEMSFNELHSLRLYKIKEEILNGN